MSKVAVTGPRDLLLPVLETIRRSAALQIDADIRKRIHDGAELQLRPLALDGKVLAERLFFEDLKLKIERSCPGWRLTATVIILLAIPETIVILGFVIAAMVLLMA